MKHQLSCKFTLLTALLCMLVTPAWAQERGGGGPPASEAGTGGAPSPAPAPGSQSNTAADQKRASLDDAFQRGGRGSDVDNKSKDDAFQRGGKGSDVESKSKRTFDRLRRILVLRQLLTLGFKSSDIASALPLLRSLRDLSSAAPADPEKAMDEEYQALLEAEPGQPLPPSSAIKITDAARYVREEQAKIRDQMLRRLGPAKTDGLNNLLGQDSKTLSVHVVEQTGYEKAPEDEGSKSSPRRNRRNDPATPGIGNNPSPGVDTSKLAFNSKLSYNLSPNYNLPAGNNGPKQNFQNPGGATGLSQPEQFGGFGKGADPRNFGAQNAPVQTPPGQFNISPTTVKVSLTELIDIMQEKLAVMSARRGNSRGN